MVDVNIVAGGNIAVLLSLEAERMGLTYRVTSLPLKSAFIYIVDAELCDGKRLDKGRTIAVNGGEDEEFQYALRWPFLISELRRMVYSILVNREMTEKAKDEPSGETGGYMALNSRSRSAVIADREIPLSPTEYLIFEALLKRRGEVLTYGELAELTEPGKSNKINVHVCFLRKKLEADGLKVIYSVRGKGFVIK